MISDRTGRLVIVVAIAASIGVATSVAPPVIAFVVPAIIALGALTFIVSTCRPPEFDLHRRVIRWTLGAFVLHLLIGIAISSSQVGTDYFGGDANFYHETAIQLARHWEGVTALPLLPAGKEGFVYVLGGTYFVFGGFVIAGLIVNAAFSAALVPLLFDTTRRLFGREAARRVVPLVVLLPGFLVWTSQLLREAGVLFFIALAVNAVVRLSERFGVFPLFTLAIALTGLFSFRGNVAFVVAIGTLGALVIGRRRVLSGIGVGATALALLAVLVAVVGVGYAGYRLSSNADLAQVNTVRTDSSLSAGSGVNPGADVSTTAHALDYLPKGIAQFLLGPFPWQIGNGRQSLGLVEVMVLWALVPALFRGLRAGWLRARRRIAVLLFPALLLTVMLSLLIGNFGTVTRERLQVLVLLLPFVALGLAPRGTRTAEQVSSGRDLVAPASRDRR
jgi:4-amino-4-deoxy-L-arabinose transferase-like glycosyltransferase